MIRQDESSPGVRNVLLTNVLSYTGPGALEALVSSGCSVACHDPAFVDEEARQRFQHKWPTTHPLRVAVADGVADEAIDQLGELDAVVFNDVYPLTVRPVEDVDLMDLRATFEAVAVFPFRLAQCVIPRMKSRHRGSLVFVTSARERRPEAGYSVPTMVRAATTAFAKTLAKELAQFQVQVNVVAPNYLASELYYPRARFVDDPSGRAMIAALVPFGRLGTPDEVGELIAFFASGRSPFVTGQVVDFAGGWP
ncbi:MAG: SDR family oxidoreductase [Rhodospirillaceae bacterium]|nr:SDR family oxidoreductase [Rhodospirillaceae bacterium]